MTVFSSMARPDFMSLTAIALAFMVITFPQQHKRRTFRLVTAFIAISFVYDLIWLLILHSGDADDAENAGRGKLIRWFGMLNVWLSFFFRIVVFGIFWKVSLHYTQIVKSQKGLVESDNQALDRIMLKYAKMDNA